MSLTLPPDTQRYASLIAAMQLANGPVFSQLFDQLDDTHEPHPLPAMKCLKSLDDLDEEEDEEDDDDADLDEEDEDEDEDLDEDDVDDLDEDDDEDEDEEEEEEDEDEDGGVKPLKM